MKQDLVDLLIVFIAIETFFIAIAVYSLNQRITELEENNKQVHEYILNRIGG